MVLFDVFWWYVLGVGELVVISGLQFEHYEGKLRIPKCVCQDAREKMKKQYVLRKSHMG